MWNLLYRGILYWGFIFFIFFYLDANMAENWFLQMFKNVWMHRSLQEDWNKCFTYLCDLAQVKRKYFFCLICSTFSFKLYYLDILVAITCFYFQFVKKLWKIELNFENFLSISQCKIFIWKRKCYLFIFFREQAEARAFASKVATRISHTKK